MTTTAATFEPSLEALANPDTLLGVDFADPGAMYPDWRGLNYDRSLPVKSIAAIVRTAVRKAVKAGTLGTATGVSVRYRSYSGGCSIDATIIVPKVKVTADTPGAVEMEDRWGERHWVVKSEGDHSAAIYPNDVIEPGAREAKRKVEALLSTFNYNRSNSQVDYFDRNFYSSVDLRDENGGWA